VTVIPKRYVGFLTFALAASLAAPASAEDACSSVTSEAAEARQSGKLLLARRLYLRCAEECPAIEASCSASASTTLDATPTVVVEAHDQRGEPVTDAKLAIDDETLADELDGRAYAVDPGRHTIVLRSKGAVVTARIDIAEGTKARPVTMTIRDPGDPDTVVRDLGGHTVWPWALVAIGGAVALGGLAVLFTTPSLPDGCKTDTRLCTKGPQETDQAFSQRQDQAGASVDQPKIGAAIIATGGLIIASALTWHFLEKVEPRTEAKNATRPRLVPWALREGGGIAVSGSLF
jgi:hypothetical protein